MASPFKSVEDKVVLPSKHNAAKYLSNLPFIQKYLSQLIKTKVTLLD